MTARAMQGVLGVAGTILVRGVGLSLTDLSTPMQRAPANPCTPSTEAGCPTISGDRERSVRHD